MSVDSMKIGDIARIDFNSRQDVIFIPEDGELTVSLVLSKTQSIVFDDITVSVDDSNDVYEVIGDNARNSRKEDETLQISSARTGFQLTNYMASPFDSELYMNFTDEKGKVGTLTNLGAQAVMRQRVSPSKIIEGSIQEFEPNMTYLYEYNGLKFLPLKYTLKTASCKIDSFTMIQLKNEDEPFEIKHYNSNDKQLS